jgi:hypothetical protein
LGDATFHIVSDLTAPRKIAEIRDGSLHEIYRRLSKPGPGDCISLRVRSSILEKKISQPDAFAVLVDNRIVVCVIADSLTAVATKRHLVQLLNPKLFGTHEPEIFFGKCVERRPAFDVERTDIAPLLDLVYFILEEDSQWQSLRTTNRWALFIDPTSAILIEKCAGADRMRRSMTQQVSMAAANLLGLYSSDRQVVETTSRTTSPTLKTLGMNPGQAADAEIDLAI